MAVRIEPADWSSADLIELLKAHVDAARRQSAVHAYDLDQLRTADVQLFEARDDDNTLLGVAGLKRLSPDHAEIKSVRTHPDHLRKGVSRALMDHLTEFASSQGYKRLSLETHPTPAYAAARHLYEALGYRYCKAFGDYIEDGQSVFMTTDLTTAP